MLSVLSSNTVWTVVRLAPMWTACVLCVIIFYLFTVVKCSLVCEKLVLHLNGARGSAPV